jgi:hypothetical protein
MVGVGVTDEVVVTLTDGETKSELDGVGVKEFVGVTDGVREFVGVILGVIDGVTELVRVILGVTDGVLLDVGVGVGVTLGQGDVHGVLSGIEIPLFGNEISTQTTEYKVVPD